MSHKKKNKRKKKHNSLVLTYQSDVGILYISMAVSIFLNLSFLYLCCSDMCYLDHDITE